MRPRAWPYVATGGLVIGLPLTGVLLRGEHAGRYLEFPPLTRYVTHAGFSWGAFVVLLLVALGLAAILLQVVRCGVRHGRTRPARAAQSGHFPFWGWAGLGLGAAAWILAWTRFSWFAPLQRHTFTPLWLAYIMVVNALCYRRTSHCLLLDAPKRFLLLFACSAVFWWAFEYLNRFVQNWYYLGVDQFNSFEYLVFATVSFSTVLPAVLSTRQLLQSFPVFDEGISSGLRLHVPGGRFAAALVLLSSGAGLALVGFLPDLLFPLLWVSPVLILSALQTLGGEDNVFNPLTGGDWRVVACSALAALACGFFWELWNVNSLAKWEYAIPFLHRFKLFEMPILGYAGYLPFGLECAAVGELVLGRRDAVSGAER